MDDRALDRLLAAMNAAVERLPAAELADLHQDLVLANLRLEVIGRQLGARAEASPYLAFVRRLTGPDGGQVLTASV